MAPESETAPKLPAPSRGWLRVALLGTLGVGAIFALVVFAYELALARVPQHRAALERLVRAQTGLDVRFSELGLRWGWYGPEAVFRHVELDEPGSTQALLRAPELVVGFDAWRTLRSGHPEAGRIELIAPEIDFSGANGSARRGVGIAASATGASVSATGASVSANGASASAADTIASATGARAGDSSALGRVAVLQRWRGGRIEIEGGTLRLPARGGNPNLFNVQIRRASLRRSDDEWSVAGLLFLPDRVGGSARVTLRVKGDLGEPTRLTGDLRVEARRLLFPGSREFLAGLPGLAPYLPRAGRGDMTVDLNFERGELVAAGGNIRAGGLVFDGPGVAMVAPTGFAPVMGPALVTGGRPTLLAASSGQASAPTPALPNTLALDRLHGDWRVTRRASGWRLRVDSLDLVKGARLATLTLDTGASESPVVPGRWIRGSLEQAPLESVLAFARWLAPHFDLAGIQLDGTARNVTFDWAAGRPEGARLQTSARLEDVALVPRSKDFTLGGLSARISGTESQLTINVQSRVARLELAQSQQAPLADIHVTSSLQVSSGRDGWQISTDEFLLEHQRASLSLSGSLQDDPTEPRVVATGVLTGADIPLVERLLGENTAQAFGAAASRLTAGRIQRAEFALRGPTSKLPFGGRGDGFTGSLTLRDAALSGGDLWPDVEGIAAHVEWRGARILATIEAGHAGPFQLATATAQWAADGASATRLTGHINGRLEEALAWVRDHPGLQEYVPDVRDIEASGNAAFDFKVSIPATLGGPGAAELDAGQPKVLARVSTFVDAVAVQAISGLPPFEGITGAFVFDAGRLQRSTLTGSWLGGPVTLKVGERREKGVPVLAVQVQGTLKAQQLASLANAVGTVEGNTDWNGELAYLPTDGSQPSRWHMRADSNLLGVVSSLPEPFAKRSVAVVPLHLEINGSNDTAQMRANLGDRMRSMFALKRKPDVGWAVERGAVRFGTAQPVLPSEPMVLVRGRASHLDLPAYALAWNSLRRDSLPALRAQLVIDQMLVGDRRYEDVSLQAERADSGTDLLIDSAAIAGMVRWPTAHGASRDRGAAVEAQPAELHLTRLDLPDDGLPSEGMGVIAALAPNAQLSVDELHWRGRSLGRLTANMTAQGNVVFFEDGRLVNGTHDARGVLHCQTAMPICRLSFKVDSTDAAVTLADFGFRPDVSASAGSVNGDVEWRPMPDGPWLASLKGTVSMRLADGSLRGLQRDAASDIDAGEFARAGDAGRAAPLSGAERAAGAERGVGVERSAGVPLSGAERTAGADRAAGADWAAGAVRGAATPWAATSTERGAGPASAAAAASDADGTFSTTQVATADANPRPIPTRPFALLAVPALVSGLDAPGATTAAAGLTKEQHELHFARLEADFDLHDGEATTSNLHFDGDAEILMRGRIGLVAHDYDQQVWVLRGEERLPAAVRRFGATPRVAAAWLSLRDLFGSGGAQDRSRAVLRLQGTWDDPMVVTVN